MIVQCVVQILKERKSLFIPIDIIQTSFFLYILKKKSFILEFCFDDATTMQSLLFRQIIINDNINVIEQRYSYMTYHTTKQQIHTHTHTYENLHLL